MSFRVATFNMQFAQVWNEANPDALECCIEESIDAIKALNADILFLQEVERVQPELGQIQPPPNYTGLKEALSGYQSVFAYPPKDERELPFGYGLAIFCRWPLFDVESVALPAPDLSFDFFGKETEPTDRLLLAAKTEIDGQVVQLLNTHLQAFFIIGHSSDDYLGQRNVVENRIRGAAHPVLLAGDFNVVPGESTVTQMESTGLSAVQKKEITWKRMPYVFDHIFYAPEFLLEQKEVRDTHASDHKMLLADFSWA